MGTLVIFFIVIGIAAIICILGGAAEEQPVFCILGVIILTLAIVGGAVIQDRFESLQQSAKKEPNKNTIQIGDEIIINAINQRGVIVGYLYNNVYEVHYLNNGKIELINLRTFEFKPVEKPQVQPEKE